MSVFVHRYEVDFLKPEPVRHTQALLVTQDAMSDRLEITVKNGGTLAGSVLAYIMRGDGQTVVQAGEITGSVVTVTLPEEAYAIPGVVLITVKHALEGVVNSLLQLTGTVKKSTTGVIVDPGSAIPDLAEIQEAALAAAHAVRYDQAQGLDTAAQALARSNIGAAAEFETATPQEALAYMREE